MDNTKAKYGLLLSFLLCFCMTAPVYGQQIKIVANEVGPPNQLNSKELSSIFKAQKQWWENDTKISISLLKSTVPISETVADKVFGMSKNEVKKYWIQIVFRGKATTPKHFESEEALISYIARTPGAIGVVSAEANTESLRVIAIDGEEVW